MPENQVKVVITGDASQLKQAASEAANSVEDLGKRSEESSEKVEKMGKGVAHLATHIGSELVPGSTRMAMTLMRLGETAAGLGPVLAAAIPVAVFAAGVEVMNKLDEAGLEDARSFAEMALETQKLNEKLMEAKERWVELTEGPMAAAVQRAADFKNKTNELEDVLKSQEKLLETNTHWWQNWSQEAYKAVGFVAMWQGLHGDSQGPMSNTNVLEKEQEIIGKFTQNKDLPQATKALEELKKMITDTGGAGAEGRVKSVQKAIEDLSIASQKAVQEEKNLKEEAAEKQRKDAAARVEVLKGEVQQQKNAWDQRISDAIAAHKLLEDADKSKIAQAEPLSGKTQDSITRELALKLQANQDEAKDSQSIIALKKNAAQADSEEQIKIAKEEAQKKIGILAAGSDEEKAKIAGVKEQLADQIKTIQSNLLKQLNDLNNQDITQQADYERRKTDITVAAQKERFEVQESDFKRVDEMNQRATGNSLKSLQRDTSVNVGSANAQDKNKLFQSGGDQDRIYQKAQTGLDNLMQKQQQYIEQVEAAKQAAQDSGNTGLAETADASLQKAEADLETMRQLKQQYANEQMQLDDRVAQHNQQSLDKMTSAFNQNVMQWMGGQERFGQAMIRTFTSMASSVLQTYLKMSEAELMYVISGKKAKSLEVLDNAKVAASKAMTAVPFPLNIPLAAAAFAGTIAIGSFAQGGIMENDGGAILHKNEMVLPPHLSAFVQNAAKGQAGSQSGDLGQGGDHFHYSPSINAIDRNGMEDALKDHGESIFRLWKAQMRDRNV